MHNSSYKNELKYLETENHYNDRDNISENHITNNNINVNNITTKNINKTDIEISVLTPFLQIL